MRRFSKLDHIKNGYISAERKHMNTAVTTHWHDFYEIEYIVSGSGSYFIDGTEYPIEEGLLFFMTPTNFHSVEMKNTELFNIMFSENICSFDLLCNLTAKAPLILKTDKASHEYFSVLMNELSKNHKNLEFAATLLNAIIAKLSFYSTPKGNAESITPIRKLELYMLNNFRSTLTLEDAAKHINLSPSYISQLFKKENGKNFKAYLNEMRFEYAKKLLLFSDMTVMQICSECGFEDYPNFIRRFKQYTGFYPLEYRKSSRNV